MLEEDHDPVMPLTLMGEIVTVPLKPPVLVAVRMKLFELPAVTLMVDWLVPRV
jgi:hypothetical protein